MTPAIPAVLDAASAPQPEVRVLAVKRLGELAGPKELPAVLNLLTAARTQEDLDAAEQALGSICAKAANPDPCVDMLTGKLAQATPTQKSALLRVLTATGGAKALGFVRISLTDQNPEVRSAAIRALTGWNTTDAAPDLLKLAQTAQTPSEKMLCLRGYMDMARRGELSQEQRLAMCRQAQAFVEKPEEKRLLLAVMGDINSVDSVKLIVPYLEEESVREEAGNAIVGIADKQIKNRNTPAPAVAALVEPLDKVSRVATTPALTEKAGKLLQEAKAKATPAK
jgi:HEAT repeat protein